MRIYLSFLGEIELTDEREIHILERHPELRRSLEKFSQVLEDPDVLRKSRFDKAVLLFYKYFASIKAGKYLMIAVKKDTRNFILTAYLTDKIKAGEAYETKKNLLNVRYDKEADVLYLSQGEPSSGDETHETEDEVLVRQDATTGEVKGLTILHFLKRSMDKATKIPLPFQFSFK